MSEQEYFHVFESILYAAIVTQIITGWSRMIAEKGNYQFSWIHLLMTIIILLFIVQRYYVFRSFGHYDDVISSWTFFFVILVPPGSAYLAVLLLFPKSLSNVNLIEIVLSKRTVIGLAMGISLGYTIYRNIFHVGGSAFMSYIPQVIGLVLVVLYISFKKPIYAAILSIYSLIGLSYFMWVA